MIVTFTFMRSNARRSQHLFSNSLLSKKEQPLSMVIDDFVSIKNPEMNLIVKLVYIC